MAEHDIGAAAGWDVRPTATQGASPQRGAGLAEALLAFTALGLLDIVSGWRCFSGGYRMSRWR